LASFVPYTSVPNASSVLACHISGIPYLLTSIQLSPSKFIKKAKPSIVADQYTSSSAAYVI